jgi:hypothetical protein
MIPHSMKYQLVEIRLSVYQFLTNTSIPTMASTARVEPK